MVRHCKPEEAVLDCWLNEMRPMRAEAQVPCPALVVVAECVGNQQKRKDRRSAGRTS